MHRLMPVLLIPLLACAEEGTERSDPEPPTPAAPDTLPPDTDPGSQGTQRTPSTAESVDCSPIAADPGFELCEERAEACEGVYVDGSGCDAFCGAAGLQCVAAYGGEPGCQLEPDTPVSCGFTGHQSDWCVCAPAVDRECATDPAATQRELGLGDAVFSERHNWVVECREYAYTAAGDEHEACDSDYAPDGSRTGTATFTFVNVPRGTYEVYVGGRHTENRNPEGALFVVDGHAVVIPQDDPSGDLVWDHHGTWCLDGDVEVTLDSTVNGGSDSVFGARLVPVP